MNQESLNPTADTVLERYDAAIKIYSEICHTNPGEWHRPDTEVFTEIKAQLTHHAETGNVRCQYALATIYWLGLCTDSETKYLEKYAQSIVEATQWWVAASKQGFWPAIDNLVSCGVGSEAERVKKACHKLELDRPDLIGRSGNMPVFGPEFMQELCRRCCGCDPRA